MISRRLFQVQETPSAFHRPHNETLSVAMRVYDPDCPPTEDTVLQNEPEQFSVLSPAEKCESKKGTLKFSHSLKRNEAARTLGVPQPLS
jgi:hypothetical protein